MTKTASRLLDDEFIAKIEQLEFVARRVIAGLLKGDRLSKRRGYSNEFADHRPYVPGDDLRFLDWNVFGRLERLFLKVFLEEEDLQLSLLIDCTASMDFGDPNKLDFARKVAAALSYIGLVNGDRVSVASFAGALRPLFGPARGRRHAARLFGSLQDIESEDAVGSAAAQSCREFALAQKGGGILVFISDFLYREGYEAALKYLLLRARSMDIYAFHVLAPQELEPTLTGDLRLVDVEDGVVSEVSISPALIKHYKKTLNTYCQGIQEFCRQRGIRYIPTSTDQAFDKLVLDYLRRRGLVK